MSKKENRFIMHYDYESRKRVFRLNGRDVTVEIERLLEAHEKEIVSTKCKLFQLDMTIQQRLQNQLALTEKALELACEKLKKLYCSDYCGNNCDDWCVTEEDLKQECKLYYKCFNKDCILEQAKEMMKSEL